MCFRYWPKNLQNTSYSIEAVDVRREEWCRLTLKWNDDTADAVFSAPSGRNLCESKAVFLKNLYLQTSEPGRFEPSSLKVLWLGKRETREGARIGTLKDVETHFWLRYCEATLKNIVFKVPYLDGFLVENVSHEAEVMLPSGYGLTPRFLVHDFWASLIDRDHDRRIITMSTSATALRTIRQNKRI